MIISNFVLGSIIVAFSGIVSAELPLIPSIDKLGNVPFKEKSISPCNACNNLAKSFLKAVDETTRQSFEGGDADWERQKLGTYENSELRFIEIQEKLCSDVTSGKDQCYNLAEVYENELEDWFFEKRVKDIDLFKFLCINQLKICCPNNTYGPNCIPCPGGVEEPCGGQGECMNGGTREEPAVCLCNLGYAGELCDECSRGYYQDKSSASFSCKVCDKACKDHCRGPGPKNCEVCSDGYHFFENEGCVEDISKSLETEDSLNDTENNEASTQSQLNDVSTPAEQLEHSEL